MKNHLIARVTALVFAVLPAAGQTPAPKTAAAAVKATWTPPRTPDGHPDLQGVWTNNSVTPLQRPKALAGKEFYSSVMNWMKKRASRPPTIPGWKAQLRKLCITITPSLGWTGSSRS